MKYLSVTTPDGASYRHPFTGNALRLGRSSSNDLVLQDQAASRHHAEIVRRPEGCFLIDAHSKNRTYLNGSQVGEAVPLRPGDMIRIGSTVLVFNDTEAAPSGIAGALADHATPGSAATGPGTITPEADELPFPISDSIAVDQVGAAGDEAGGGEGAAGRLEARGEMTGPPLASPEQMSRIIFAADEQLAFHRPLNRILEAVMDLARDAVCYERGVLLRRRGDALVPEVERGAPGEAGRPVSFSRTIARHALTQRRAILISKEPGRIFPGTTSIDGENIRSVMCVPLWNHREVIGVVYVDNRSFERRFTRRDLQVLTFLANIAALKIDNAELFNMTLEAQGMYRILQEAAAIQRGLLPQRSPAIPGYLLDGDSIPCFEVGGDLYDYHTLGDGRFGIGVGDVAGKGLPAALVMSHFQAAQRALSELRLPPEEMIGRLNRILCRCLPENRYVTFFYGILDPARHTFTYVNAGHPAPLCVRRGGEVERLKLNHLFIGMFEDHSYGSETIRLEPDDLIICYSDGVTEQEDPDKQPFGDRRLEALAGRIESRAPRDVLETILSAVDGHSGGRRHTDDVTLVILKREGRDVQGQGQ
ncbi:MAG TPA: SpoIIE family protein phosphatase [Candidatus Polarisedimenticolia bacterium]|nr:SpoIIE family protein phosphatase [Candidatus Polarisedimenticolia bacterium]